MSNELDKQIGNIAKVIDHWNSENLSSEEALGGIKEHVAEADRIQEEVKASQ